MNSAMNQEIVPFVNAENENDALVQGPVSALPSSTTLPPFDPKLPSPSSHQSPPPHSSPLVHGQGKVSLLPHNYEDRVAKLGTARKPGGLASLKKPATAAVASSGGRGGARSAKKTKGSKADATIPTRSGLPSASRGASKIVSAASRRQRGKGSISESALKVKIPSLNHLQYERLTSSDILKRISALATALALAQPQP